MSGHEIDPQVEAALASLNPLERALWGGIVKRNLSRSGTRLSRMIPKYGVRASTQNVVANMWLLPAFLGFVGIPLISSHSAGSRGLGIFLVILAFACLVFALFRVSTSFRSRKAFRQSQTNSDGS
jgi:hypothetical protein